MQKRWQKLGVVFFFIIVILAIIFLIPNHGEDGDYEEKIFIKMPDGNVKTTFLSKEKERINHLFILDKDDTSILHFTFKKVGSPFTLVEEENNIGSVSFTSKTEAEIILPHFEKPTTVTYKICFTQKKRNFLGLETYKEIEGYLSFEFNFVDNMVMIGDDE